MKIVVTGGGTGGHVFPGLAVAKAFPAEESAYIGSYHGLENQIVPGSGVAFYRVASRGILGRGIFGKIKSVFLIGAGFFQSVGILARLRPDVVVGTGGYVCLPVILAASALSIPSVLLEQNLLPGRTTRFLSKFVRAVLTSFDETKDYLPRADRSRVTGTPVRQGIGSMDKLKAREVLGLDPDLPVFTVMGASQGARALNLAVLGALSIWSEKALRIQILHLTGSRHYENILEQTKKFSASTAVRYHSYAFMNDMTAVYGASDLIIARAGATTLAEIMASGKPSVLIPYPYAADNHQEVNARWLEKHGACRVILEEDFSAEILARLAEDWLSDSSAATAMGEKAKSLGKPDALERIIEAAKEVANRT